MYIYNVGTKFESIVDTFSENVILQFSKNEHYSYKELNERANQISRFLARREIGKGDVVCVSGSKGILNYAAIIACLKSGVIYCFFDPDSPSQRLERIFARCNPRVLLVDDSFKQNFPDLSVPSKPEIHFLESKLFALELTEFKRSNVGLNQAITGSDPAYIMFTSGSTGFPKGVLITHDNLLNFIEWGADTFGFTEEDVFTGVNPLYFDNAVFDMYSSFFSGGRLISFSKDVVAQPKALIELIDEMKCTVWFSVPSLLIFLQTMKVLTADRMRFVRKLIFGGEGYPKSKLVKLFETYETRTELINVYGPTEATCICSSHVISRADFQDLIGFSPLGKMSKNFSYSIYDDELNRVEDGVVGELYLKGPNIASGYYNDSERTEVSFIQNPENSNYEEIIYKTGDLVKYNADDDKIYILGRKDHQVKHMGYRVELEEIESALSQLDYVSQSVVFHSMASGFSRIIAVLAVRKEVEQDKVRNDLKDYLPAYMMPTVFHFEEVLRKNANGKVDRQKLEEIYVD